MSWRSLAIKPVAGCKLYSQTAVAVDASLQSNCLSQSLMSIIRIRWHMQRPILQPIWPCRWQAAEHLLEVVYVQLPSKLPQSLANANMV